LRNSACIMVPASASVAPTAKAVAARTKRNCSSVAARLPVSPCSKARSPSNNSDGDSATEPTAPDTSTAASDSAANSGRYKPAFRLVPT